MLVPGEPGVRVVGAAATGMHIQQFSRGCTRGIYSEDDGWPFTGLPPLMISAETLVRLFIKQIRLHLLRPQSQLLDSENTRSARVHFPLCVVL